MCPSLRTTWPLKWLMVHIPDVRVMARIGYGNMGGCLNYGPLLGPLNTRCRIILRTQKGTISLTATHTQTPGRIPKVYPPQGSVVCNIGVSESSIGGSTFWILSGFGYGASFVFHLVLKEVDLCRSCGSDCFWAWSKVGKPKNAVGIYPAGSTKLPLYSWGSLLWGSHF